MTYLVVFESDTWRVNREVLVEALENDWPEARVVVASPDDSQSNVHDIEWWYETAVGELEGYAHANGKGIYLEGPVDIVADFAVWYRKLIPDDLHVVFCDDGYNFDSEILPTTSKDDVLSNIE